MEIKESAHFIYVRSRDYLDGKLKMPIIKHKESGNLVGLLPCNPEKQSQYPQFVGYLRQFDPNGNELRESGVSATHDGPKISGPVKNPELAHEALTLLMEIAESEGHKFPGQHLEELW